jgi:hypothetical protein
MSFGKVRIGRCSIVTNQSCKAKRKGRDNCAVRSIKLQVSLCIWNLKFKFVCCRYQAGDFSGQMLAEVSALKTPRPAFAPLFTNQFGINHQNWVNKVSGKVSHYVLCLFTYLSSNFVPQILLHFLVMLC